MMDAATLRELLHYDPETGVFTHAVDHGRAKTGQRVGSKNTNGHLQMWVRGKHFLAHRLAWLYMTGRWPEKLVDHRNRVKTDNRWANLRLCTPQQNQANAAAAKHNTTGLKGVSFSKKHGKFFSQMRNNGEKLFLGLYETAAQAKAAYDLALYLHKGEYACYG